MRFRYGKIALGMWRLRLGMWCNCELRWFLELWGALVGRLRDSPACPASHTPSEALSRRKANKACDGFVSVGPGCGGVGGWVESVGSLVLTVAFA